MINISWLTSILTDELSLPKKVIEHLFDKFSQTSSQKAFEAALLKDSFCQLKGLVGSGLSFKLVSAYKNLDRTFLMVLDNAEQAAYHLNDLEQLLPSKEVLFFPASYRQAYNPEATDNANVLLRSEVLKKLSYSKKKICKGKLERISSKRKKQRSSGYLRYEHFTKPSDHRTLLCLA